MHSPPVDPSQFRQAIERSRPWQDASATAAALHEAVPGLAPGQAIEVAELLAELAPTNTDNGATVVAATLMRNVLAGRDATLGLKSGLTARELIAFGVPRSTAYRLEANGMPPDEALGYAFTAIQRELHTAQRVRKGANRATARRDAARRYPFSQ